MDKRELGFTISHDDPSFHGCYAKMVSKETDETIALIVRRDLLQYNRELEMNEFDLYIHEMYIVWTLNDMDAELVIAFDLVPIVHVEDLALFMFNDDGVKYLEYNI